MILSTGTTEQDRRLRKSRLRRYAARVAREEQWRHRHTLLVFADEGWASFLEALQFGRTLGRKRRGNRVAVKLMTVEEPRPLLDVMEKTKRKTGKAHGGGDVQ